VSGPSLRELLRVPSDGTPVDLAAIDPAGTPGLPGPETTGIRAEFRAGAGTAGAARELARYQEMLFARAKVEPGFRRRVLIIIEGVPGAGRDAVVARALGAIHPLGLMVPTITEPAETGAGPEAGVESHDWPGRWRLPDPGLVGVLVRSYYGCGVDSPQRMSYAAVNEFEAQLTDSGFTLVKVLLHLSYEKQRERLLARLADPARRWRYTPVPGDPYDRWVRQQQAYADLLGRCGSVAAPWFVVPADRPWYRDWAVANLLREIFAELMPDYPEIDIDVEVERRRFDATREVVGEHWVNDQLIAPDQGKAGAIRLGTFPSISQANLSQVRPPSVEATRTDP
jgi:polyphosphate kinase 2 (PPK2 family)